MRRVLTVLTVCLVAGVVTTPLLAQKSAPPVTRDSDRDGVPDTRDRCRGTAVGVRVDANGCPVAAAPAPQTAAAPAPATTVPAATAAPAPTRGLPTTATPPATASPPAATAGAAGMAAGQPPSAPAPTPATAAPATSTPAPQTAAPTQQAQTGRPSGLPAPAAGAPSAAGAAPAGVIGAAGAVSQGARGNQPATTSPAPATATPPATSAPAPAAVAAAPARPAPTVTDPTLTAGFWLPAYNGATDADMLEYGRTLTIRLDSAINALVDVFRNTTGAPVMGASGPNILSTREKGRWQRCRLIHFDLGTLGEGVTFLKDTLTAPTLARAALTLSDAFEAQVSSAECDNVVSMVEAPDRWAPFQQNYENSARAFYRDWYAQIRTVHEANRGFARALNSALPAARQFPIFPALPPTPPTIGAVR